MKYIHQILLRRRALMIVVLIFGVVTISSQVASASVIGILAGPDLSLGSRGADVADLQGLLVEQGYLEIPFGVPFGYFGPLTHAGLARYQASIGVPATGYYGPMTKSRIREVFSARGWMTLLARENG